jgi:uncharacterized membrane protein
MSNQSSSGESLPGDALSAHVAQTVETVVTVRARAQSQVTRHQRAIETFTAALGRPRTLYVIVVMVAGWCLWNVWQATPVDPPPFFWLQGAVGLSAVMIATLILITQNRQNREGEQRAQLDLQVNLLTEQKITKVIQLLEELRRDLPNVKNRVDLAADAMTHAVDAGAVLSALEQTLEAQGPPSDQAPPSDQSGPSDQAPPPSDPSPPTNQGK